MFNDEEIEQNGERPHPKLGHYEKLYRRQIQYQMSVAIKDNCGQSDTNIGLLCCRLTCQLQHATRPRLDPSSELHTFLTFSTIVLLGRQEGAEIYDDDVGWITLARHDASTENVCQDSVRESDTSTREEGAATILYMMERLLEHWAEESLQPNSAMNLIEFLQEAGDGEVLNIEDLDLAPVEMEDSHPKV
ncbi:unnamed protein product [Prunus armeniaca]|uniref:Uncharacterized protein n=1 Tax=Prunus armeniaca TaxID=36596 RepID=A0A6J5VLS0_PRUAR|nr:unnamed protein product [Prunus armeniaca]